MRRKKNFLVSFILFYSKHALCLRRKEMRKFFRFFLPLEIFRWVNKFTLLLKAISFVDEIFYKYKISRKILGFVMLLGRKFVFQQTLAIGKALAAGLVFLFVSSRSVAVLLRVVIFTGCCWILWPFRSV